MSVKISGEKYAMMYGPTVGDKVRLADTSLVVEVEKDFTTYGDEIKFGGGKTIRDGMGQSVKTCSKDGDLDLVITNALIVDVTGIIKADIGIKDGKIAGIGQAAGPDGGRRWLPAKAVLLCGAQCPGQGPVAAVLRLSGQGAGGCPARKPEAHFQWRPAGAGLQPGLGRRAGSGPDRDGV